MSDRIKLLFFVTEDWYFISHRLPIAIAAIKQGYDVTLVTRVSKYGETIRSKGIKLIPLKLSRGGINPVSELGVIFRLISIYRKEKPNIVHHVAVKPVLYGTIAAIFSKVPHVVNALAGLGYIFTSDSLKARILKPFVSLAFRQLLSRRNSRIILQNPDDAKLLCDAKISKAGNVTIIRGSGVDTQTYIMRPEPVGVPVILLASRLLWDKGIGEFIEAATILKKKGVVARFVLAGDVDEQNPSSIPNDKVKDWIEDGLIEWLGHREDMPEVISQSNIVCLPSYREGLPKVLIEAASCGRAIVATDIPGCREIVQDNYNGLLVKPRDPEAIAEALEKLIISPSLRIAMGEKGRKLVEEEFSIQKIVLQTTQLYKEICC